MYNDDDDDNGKLTAAADDDDEIVSFAVLKWGLTLLVAHLCWTSFTVYYGQDYVIICIYPLHVYV